MQTAPTLAAFCALTPRSHANPNTVEATALEYRISAAVMTAE